MCGPMTVGAVLGAGQAVAGHMSAVSQASADNKNRARLYKQEQAQVMNQHLTDIGDHYARGVDAEITWDQNALDYNLLAAAEQYKINKTIEAAYRAYEDKYTKYTRNIAVTKSLQRSGKSAQRVGRSLRAGMGREMAAELAKIDTAKTDFTFEAMALAGKKAESDRKARAMIGMEPQRGAEPTKPTWNKGPGLLSLAAGVGMGIWSGRAAGKAIKG